jgi:hypothetical protein
MWLGIAMQMVVVLGGVGVLALSGFALVAGSRTLLRDAIGDDRLGDAIAGLVTLGFLLLDAGLVALIAAGGVGGGTPATLLASMLGRVGWLLVAIAATHLVFLAVLSAIRGGIHARRGREIREAAWAEWNEEMRRHHQRSPR